MPKAVNWEQLVGNVQKVIYSSLELPDFKREVCDRNIVALQLTNGYHIDVEWFEGKYCVTLFLDDIEEPASERTCKNADEVIEIVKQLAQRGDMARKSATPRAKPISFPVLSS